MELRRDNGGLHSSRGSKEWQEEGWFVAVELACPIGHGVMAEGEEATRYQESDITPVLFKTELRLRRTK